MWIVRKYRNWKKKRTVKKLTKMQQDYNQKVKGVSTVAQKLINELDKK